MSGVFVVHDHVLCGGCGQRDRSFYAKEGKANRSFGPYDNTLISVLMGKGRKAPRSLEDNAIREHGYAAHCVGDLHSRVAIELLTFCHVRCVIRGVIVQ